MRTYYDSEDPYERKRKLAWGRILHTQSKIAESSATNDAALTTFNSVSDLMEWLDREDNETT